MWWCGFPDRYGIGDARRNTYSEQLEAHHGTIQNEQAHSQAEVQAGAIRTPKVNPKTPPTRTATDRPRRCTGDHGLNPHRNALGRIYFRGGDPVPKDRVHPMKEFKEFWKQYSPYFLDIWQYLVILLVVIIAAIVIL